VISISVFGVRELEKSTRVSNSGKVHFPGLGILLVANMTPSQLERDIAQRLQAAGLVKNPTVHVRLAQRRAQPVYILGEVMMPGQFVINDEMRVLDLLTLAAGFNDVASNVGYLYRRKLKETDPSTPDAPRTATTVDEAIEIDFAALTSGTRPELNLRLQGGDILYVPVTPRARYFIVGDVNQTGGFEMRLAEPILVTEALARAGGPTRTAKLSKGILVRVNAAGEREELPVDFNAILKGKKPDFEVRPNDIVFMPGSSAKTLAYGLLNTIPATAGRLAVIP
jgi:protein involved in polysaccharide export with SLBB domain